MQLLDEIRAAVIEGRWEQSGALTRRALNQSLSPSEILNGALIPAMDEVGVKFQNNDFFLPEVLIAAKAMNSAMEILKPLLTQTEAKPKGKIVIGTVQGDRHDIGKNLVAMMMEGAGFEVIDLGVDVSPQHFVKAVEEHHPDIVAMSALLTTTMPAMKETIQALKEAGLRETVKTMIGGAPVSLSFAEEVGADAHAPDSAAAVAKMKEILEV
ncbi:MAG: corrinoid protein [Gemmatimonadota bacterium]|nr:MAG: corrinoid protein [Gemmatimonadota bacterium]